MFLLFKRIGRQVTIKQAYNLYRSRCEHHRFFLLINDDINHSFTLATAPAETGTVCEQLPAASTGIQISEASDIS
jgi:hypothetical protein